MGVYGGLSYAYPQGVNMTKVPPAEYILLPPMFVNVFAETVETVVTPESATMPLPAIDPKLVL
jgi:hypothetical protein